MMDMVAARLGSPRLSSRSDIAFGLVERRLGEATWFAGEEFTAADIMMVYPLTGARAHADRDISKSPNLLAYLKRVAERPGYRAAMAKAEPDSPPNLD
jgi:glutathione S-transferase